MTFILQLAKIIFAIIAIYYGVKFFRLKNNRRQGVKKRFIYSSIAFILLLLFGTQPSSVKSSTDSNVKIVKKYVGKDKYEIAKDEHTALVAKKKKLEKQVDKSQDKKDEIVDQQRQEKEDAAREQARQQEEAQKRAQEDAKAQEKAQSQQAKASTDSGSGVAKGDMNTSSSGQIVGNKNSHIYHVPGQRGYNMNSSNAVYFNSEQEAIAAGYRKAKV